MPKQWNIICCCACLLIDSIYLLMLAFSGTSKVLILSNGLRCSSFLFNSRPINQNIHSLVLFWSASAVSRIFRSFGVGLCSGTDTFLFRCWFGIRNGERIVQGELTVTNKNRKPVSLAAQLPEYLCTIHDSFAQYVHHRHSRCIRCIINRTGSLLHRWEEVPFGFPVRHHRVERIKIRLLVRVVLWC